MSYRSYGNYDSNVPMKTFAGQPQVATMADVRAVHARMSSLHPEEARGVGMPSCASMDPCKVNCNNAKDKQQCMYLRDMCARMQNKTCDM